MPRFSHLLGVCVIVFAVSAYGQGRPLSPGRSPTPEQMRQSDSTVLPDGRGLPPGSGTVPEGQKVYADKCSGCHGDNGQGNEPLGSRLVGGFGTLMSNTPVATVGSYWPYATTVWDYIHRAMPYPRPGTLSANETYAVTAYLLYLNKIVGRNEVMNRAALPKVPMPNRHGFVSDPRPDVACREKK